MGVLLATGLLAGLIGVAGAMAATTTRPTAASSSLFKGYFASSTPSAELTYTRASSQTRSVKTPVARTAIGPLAVPVASFILKGLASGVLSKVGGEAFGKVLSEVGFPDQGAQTLEALRAVDVKLDQIKQSLTELNSKVDGLSVSLAFARLSNVRTSVRDLIGRIDDARARLQQLSGGKITDPTLRREKRAELLEIIKTKLLTEQNTLNQAIDSTQGNDDIIHMAFLAERTKGGRFWSQYNWDRAADIVRYYNDEAAQLLLLRVEYEYSSVKQDSTPLYIAERKAIAQDMVDRQVEEFSRFNGAYPSQMGNYSTVVDTKPGPDGKYQVWVNDGRFNDYLFPLGESAPNQYQDNYPSLAEYRHLVSGRGSQSTTDYLRSQGFILPLSCTKYSRQPASAPSGTQTVFWTRDIGGGGRRWAWGEHDDGQGQLNWACGNIRVRDLYPWERFF